MDGKLTARIAAAAFIAVAILLSVTQLRDERAPMPSEEGEVIEADRGPLAAQLRTCSAMGEPALADPECLGAWAEKRRRFFGPEREAGGDLSQPAAAGEGQ